MGAAHPSLAGSVGPVVTPLNMMHVFDTLTLVFSLARAVFYSYL